MLDKLVSFRLPILVSFVLMTLVAGWFSRYFEIDASAETLLTKDNELYLQSQLNNLKFSPEEFILVAYRPHSGDLFSDQSMNTISELSARFESFPRVSKVNALTNIPLISAGGELTAEMDPQEFTWTSRQHSADELRSIFTDHPIFSDLLVNAEQTAAAIQVVFAGNNELRDINAEILSLQQQQFVQELGEDQQARLTSLEAQADGIEQELAQTRSDEIDEMYRIIADYQQNADIFLGGNFVLAEHLVDIISSDLVVFGLSIAACICLLLVLVFRDLRWVLLPLGCCLVSVVLTVGLFAILGFKTTVISSNFIALQLILTLALTIHLIVQYQQLANAKPDLSHHELLKETVRLKITPCLYAGITTAIGFGSLLLSELQPVMTFAWMMIVAMAVSIAVSLLLFPTLLAFTQQRLSSRQHSLSKWLLERSYRLTTQYPRTIMAGSLILFILGASGLLWLNVENSFLNYFRESTQIRQELVFIDRELGGSTPLDIIYHPDSTDNGDLIVTAAQIRILQQIQATLESSDAAGKTMSVVNFTELAMQMNSGQPLTEYELNSLYVLLDQNLRDDLVGSYLDAESGDFRINTRLIDSTEGFDRAAFLAALRQSMTELGLDQDEYSLSNLFVLYQDILQQLYDSQISTMGFVYVALGLVLLLVFRSPKIAIIALIPNILATLLILGGMGWFGIPLDLMTITITAIAMGIAVDDTIHFVHHYLAAKNAGDKAPVKSSFDTVGYAMLYTSAIIAVGFSTLVFSDFVPSILFGLLTAAAMILALLTALTLLPVLLARFAN